MLMGRKTGVWGEKGGMGVGRGRMLSKEVKIWEYGLGESGGVAVGQCRMKHLNSGSSGVEILVVEDRGTSPHARKEGERLAFNPFFQGTVGLSYPPVRNASCSGCKR